MFYQLPPVGNPVRVFGGAATEAELRDVLSPYSARYFDSGTAALAAAIIAAIKRKGVDIPEVILPAYGCPDLVSAALFAGARPMLVDLESERPWMDLEQLSSSITASTVAIVAVDLFGIPERLPALREIARQHSVLLIEDSAQGFPGGGDEPFWDGDLVIISFGRGKPVSLLGGGAVLFREAGLGELIPEPTPQSAGTVEQRLGFWLKASLYNLMISPYSYWIPQGLPFLHLGETRFHPLKACGRLDSARQQRLPANVKAYRQRGLQLQSVLSGLIAEMAAAGKAMIDLPAVCQLPPSRRLLRYPILLDPGIRDRVHDQLRHEGLGPSTMYPASLPDLPGLDLYFESKYSYPSADSFASRLLTLPLHEKVTAADMDRIGAVLALSVD